MQRCCSLLICTLLVACKPAAERAPRSAQAASPLVVSSVERGSLRTVDAESLSDSAHVTSLVPEGDGDAIAFTFADPARHIAAALGLIDRQHTRALLVWPDSVTAAWWPEAHQLAFTSTTGHGLHIVLGVHTAPLHVVVDTSVPTVHPPALPHREAGTPARERATAYVDSVRLRFAGRAERSMLRYSVARLLAAPADSLVAFYVVATDSAGTQFNPSWYILDPVSSQVQPVDSLVARVGGMPMEGAVWGPRGHFLYVKEKTLYEARISR